MNALSAHIRTVNHVLRTLSPRLPRAQQTTMGLARLHLGLVADQVELLEHAHGAQQCPPASKPPCPLTMEAVHAQIQ